MARDDDPFYADDKLPARASGRHDHTAAGPEADPPCPAGVFAVPAEDHLVAVLEERALFPGRKVDRLGPTPGQLEQAAARGRVGPAPDRGVGAGGAAMGADGPSRTGPDADARRAD